MAASKIEQYLIDLMYTYQQAGDDLWIIDDDEHELCDVAVALTDSLVTVRVTVMKEPAQRRLEFYAKLLELNAKDMIHGAYAIEDGKVLLIDTLEYDSMDFTEFRAALDAFSLALTQHYPVLKEFRN